MMDVGSIRGFASLTWRGRKRQGMPGMTATTGGRDRVSGWRSRPAAALLLLSAAGAWIAVVAVGHGMGAMPGTMGPGAFVGVWTLMMAAMMLPGVAPFASFYTRTFTEHRQRRLLAFASGYLLVWAAIGLPAFCLAWIADRLVADHATAATALAALVFLSCGVYQLTPFKNRCLALCRSPLGFTLKYSAYHGRSRDLRAGALHGVFCAGCCWALMLLLLAFGLMNVLAMLTVAAVVFIEKTWRRGAGFARALGVVSIVLAVLVVAHPAIAPGLHSPNSAMTKGTM
jgi:predicted metal-binding membrane protein